MWAGCSMVMFVVQVRWVKVFQRAASFFNGLGVALLESGALVSCPPTYRLLWQLKKALPAVSLSVTDLRSLCSKITAQPSTAVLMHMKQNGWMVQTRTTHGCTCTHACTDRKAGADICSANKSDLIAMRVYIHTILHVKNI